MNRRSVELIAAGLFGALFGFLFTEGIGYSGRSAYVPAAASGIGFLMCCLWALKSVRVMATGQAESLDASGSEISRFALIVASGAAYVAGFIWIGFFTSTLIVVPVLAALLGYRNWKVLVVTTIGFVILLYGVFRLLLSVPLPPEAILTLMGV